MKDIIYYEKENWKKPLIIFYNFLKKNNKQLLTKIYFKIDLLAYDKLSVDDVKYLKEKIYELRIKDQSNICRVFYFIYFWNSIVLLDWFIKKDNKLKREILNKIIKYKKNFIKRFWKK